MKTQFLIPLFLISFQLYAQCTEDECGPHPGMPNYLCSDGVTVAGPGDCIQNDDGQCSWEIIYCPQSTLNGYLRSIEASFCMDACAYYHLETEDGGNISNITSLDNIESLSYYTNRYVSLNGEEVWCVECGAVDVHDIAISHDCDIPVDCFEYPCLVESCPAYPNAGCVANYCGGCHADYYNVNGELITDCEDISSCPGDNPAGCFQNGCPEGYECIDDWENNCVSSYCSCDEITGQWMCTGDCNGGSCIEVDVSEECGISSSCDDCTDSGCFWQPTEEGICADECLIADLDCYGSAPNWVAECPEDGNCTDLSGLFFGWCDMALGVGYTGGSCQYISGCGWDVDGVDYSGAFFDSMDACEDACGGGDMTCDEIIVEYESLHSDEYITCDYDNDCIAVWGHCDVGLGGCHYSVNEENYPGEEIDGLVDMWIEGDCMQWVCDCSAEPYAQCIDGTCTSAYCMNENPAGCNQTGCPDGYECVVNPNDCVPSSCYCDGFYGDWYCTEDCGGGSCVESGLLGDLNGDGLIDILDIVLAVDAILHSEYDPMGDLNGDGGLNVVDIILMVNIILGV